MTHSLAAMTETLRADPGSYGVVSGVGMHMQKHAYGVWSTSPVAPGDVPDGPAPYVAAEEPAPIVTTHEGAATVAAYSVLHGRDEEPERALLVCNLPTGGRCYAFLDGGRTALEEAEATELVGRPVTLTPDGAVNLASQG
jgi:acetyl-CoA C-acetyltransferase